MIKATDNQAPTPIRSKETPRERLAISYPDLNDGRGLPIRGGWGYSKEDACIIDKNHPAVDQSLRFDGAAIEYVFVEKRIYEEMIILSYTQNVDRFAGIRWEFLGQELHKEDGKYYDKLTFEITAFHEGDWELLKAEFEGPQGYESPDFDAEAHDRKRQEKMVRFTRDFWFEITSFFGSSSDDQIDVGETSDSELHFDLDKKLKVLDLIEITLPAEAVSFWRSQDVEENGCKGALFTGYNEEGDVTCGIQITDASGDDSELDVSKLGYADIATIDDYLREEYEKEYRAQGMAIIEWVPSVLHQPKEFPECKYLSTAYRLQHQDGEVSIVVFRSNIDGRNFVFMSFINSIDQAVITAMYSTLTSTIIRHQSGAG